MSFRKEKSNTDLATSSKKTSKKESSHHRLTSGTKSPSSRSALSPRSAPDTSASSFNLVIREQILDLTKKKYADSVGQFINFIKIYRKHNPDTRKDILDDDVIIEKITEEIISTFSKKKGLRKDLASEFAKRAISEDELKHFNAILLNKKVNERLKKNKSNAILLEDNIGKLCTDIKEILKQGHDNPFEGDDKSVATTPANPFENDDKLAVSATPNPFEDEDKPTINATNPFEDEDKVAENPFDDMPSMTESRPIPTESVIAPPMPINVSLLAPPAIIYSLESETADREIDVVLNAVKKHLKHLKEQARLDPLKKDVYYTVDNLYSHCHTAIKIQQRTTKDITHQSILESNECMLLKELDLVLESVYKPNDIHSLTPEQFGQNILDKRTALQKYDRACKQRQLPETLGNLAVAVGIALAVTVACAVVGAFVGFLATAWSGPGAAAGAFYGLFIGGNIGWAEGVLLASCIMGISASTIASKFWLFKDSNEQKQINAVKNELTTLVENENKLKFAP